MSLLTRLQRTLGDAPATPAASTPRGTPAPSLAPALERLSSGLLRHLGPPPTTAADHHRGLFASPVDFATALPTARSFPTPHGLAWSVQTRHCPDTTHGHVRLRDALVADFAPLARLTGDGRLDGFHPSDAVFLDIETTGLEHGSGNVAFMIAIGWFENESFVLEQLILRDPSTEAAMLARLWTWLESRPFLVSFNGKCFDLSILQNRLVMHRFSSPEHIALKLRPHLDLLHVSRAFFKGAWPDTRLQTLETQALGFIRPDDMPGSMAPSCYFAWLREHNAAPLRAIATHNRDDVLTMVALTALLGRFAAPLAISDRPATVTRNLFERLLLKKQPDAALAFFDLLLRLPDVDIGPRLLEQGLIAARRANATPRLTEIALNLLGHVPDHPAALRALKRHPQPTPSALSKPTATPDCHRSQTSLC